MESITLWKERAEAMLPPVHDVVRRNKGITATYADIYLDAPEIYKWAGMAAFASFHVGLAMVAFEWTALQQIGVEEACNTQKRNMKTDLNLVRHLNNRIFDDIGWVHVAYCHPEGGIEKLRELLTNDEHYQPILAAFEEIHLGREWLAKGETQKGEDLIWKANAAILWHEQSAVVQPVFNTMGASFSRILSFCASFDYSTNHLKTDWKSHSSFLAFMFTKGFSLLRESFSLPDLTELKHRWFWIENRLLGSWRATEKNNPEIVSKFEELKAFSTKK